MFIVDSKAQARWVRDSCNPDGLVPLMSWPHNGDREFDAGNPRASLVSGDRTIPDFSGASHRWQLPMDQAWFWYAIYNELGHSTPGSC